ncbi:MAG: hypothetical protein JKY49_04615 [Cohaesibacteraceae bacterium]|nr:hypothetical protein [Cohaesibacteraceae bacterium]MBL4875849.1 hypothetical protein [Cohaesibacteraceae bacterium]MBL4877170.1 hypothetical protein [Cohaesibacteraceae bacterium]
MNGSVSQDRISPTFSNSVRIKAVVKKRTPPVSVRFSDEERSLLRQLAGNERLSSYIRRCALNGDVRPRTLSSRNPVKDHEALARVLSVLGQTEIVAKLDVLVGRLIEDASVLDEGTEALLWAACSDVSAMRSDLIIALGLRDLSAS